jgi:hypothetical protein
MTPDQRRDAVAAILAAGLLRLRDRAALQAQAGPENSPLASPETLELPGQTSVTVRAG